MRSVQEIFDLVICGSYYSRNSDKFSSPFMCEALKLTYYDGVITLDECQKASIEINNYLRGYLTLRNFLNAKGYKNSFVNSLVIYKKWNNRPFQ